MVLLKTTSAVIFSVCNGDGGCVQPISERVFLRGTSSLAVMKSAPNSASASEDMKNW